MSMDISEGQFRYSKALTTMPTEDDGPGQSNSTGRMSMAAMAWLSKDKLLKAFDADAPPVPPSLEPSAQPQASNSLTQNDALRVKGASCTNDRNAHQSNAAPDKSIDNRVEHDVVTDPTGEVSYTSSPNSATRNDADVVPVPTALGAVSHVDELDETDGVNEQQQPQQRRMDMTVDALPDLSDSVTRSPSIPQTNSHDTVTTTQATNSRLGDKSAVIPIRAVSSMDEDEPSHDNDTDPLCPSRNKPQQHTMQRETAATARAQTAPARANNNRPPNAPAPHRTAAVSHKTHDGSSPRGPPLSSRSPTASAARHHHLAGRIRPWSASELTSKRTRGARNSPSESAMAGRGQTQQQQHRSHAELSGNNKPSAASLTSPQLPLMVRYYRSQLELNKKQRENQEKEFEEWREANLSKSHYMNFATDTMSGRQLRDMRKEAESAKASTAAAIQQQQQQQENHVDAVVPSASVHPHAGWNASVRSTKSHVTNNNSAGTAPPPLIRRAASRKDDWTPHGLRR